MITVSILGVGARGGFTYGRYMNMCKDKYKIVSLCDKNQDKLDKYSAMFGIGKDQCFLNEEEFFSEKRSDLLVIATLDEDHVRHALKALELGYNILLEKPLTADENECRKLVEAEKKSKGRIFVCHVLRYTAMIKKMKELLDSGIIGKLVLIDHTEQIEYWHMAHSYVRGNWRKEEETSPILLAKCCHDLDLIQYFADSKCNSVSSIGSLVWFKSENAPTNASERCLSCIYQDDCCYSAKRLYIDRWKDSGCPQDWPYNVITDKICSEETLREALENGPYGRCVYHCDNDVYDHQVVNMEFENGVHAVLKMVAFTWDWGRQIKLYGSLGDIILDQGKDIIEVKVFGKPSETIRISELTSHSDILGHGGGDQGLVDALYDALTGQGGECYETSLDNSVESHYIAFAADRSAKKGGTLERIKRD